MSGFRTRAITGLSFAAVVFGGIFFSKYTFVLLFFLIGGLCLWELFSHTLKDENPTSRSVRMLAGMTLALLPLVVVDAAVVQDLPLFHYLSKIALFLLPMFLLIFIYELFTKTEQPFANLAFIALGIFYITIPMILLSVVAFRKEAFSPVLVFGMLILVWANDTAAYMTGSQIGKHKFFPRISPKKTWEGIIGGALGALIVSGLCYLVFKNESLTLLEWFGLGLIIAIFGPLGDLVESMMKRSLGIKDSGNLLPGHGGFLDRFDAFIFIIPFSALYLHLIGQL